MIHGLIHQGSGLGNQLHRYVATRVLALDKGYDFSMITPHNFKGSGFMDLDTGKTYEGDYYTKSPSGEIVPFDAKLTGKDLPVWKEKTNYYNPEFNFIEDKTIIDGEFQDERYFEHRLEDIKEWLYTTYLSSDDDTCLIGFRGGEFSIFPELFLTKEYWDEGIRLMNERGIYKFIVHTDDEPLAKKFFPDYSIIQDMEANWRYMRYTKHAIIANSSFYILPRLLSGGVTIAPRYWARRNTKEWSMPQNYYKKFLYI